MKYRDVCTDPKCEYNHYLPQGDKYLTDQQKKYDELQLLRRLEKKKRPLEVSAFPETDVNLLKMELDKLKRELDDSLKRKERDDAYIKVLEESNAVLVENMVFLLKPK